MSAQRAVRVSTTTETVTPAMAESWLEKNKDNRPVRDHHVKRLAKDMVDGRWQLNGEAIVFDFNGDLIDGQHRLWGCFNSGAAFVTVVVRGVDPDAFQTIDSGMKRSAGDVLDKAGISYGTLTAATVRLVHFYEQGRRDHSAFRTMSNAETLALVEKYPAIVDAVTKMGPRGVFKRFISLTALSAWLYFAAEHDGEKASAFLEAVASGADVKRGDARLTCRNCFLNARQRSVTLTAHTQFALLIKAWNAYAAGRELISLRYIEGEAFPIFEHRLGKKAGARSRK